jgi:predicted transcriptional regulator
MEELDSGRPLSKDVLFISLEDDDWKGIFTEKRTELIRSIASGKPGTVGALARRTNRPRESVSRDLSYLERLHIIRMQRNGKERIPVINKRFIVTAVPTYG